MPLQPFRPLGQAAGAETVANVAQQFQRNELLGLASQAERTRQAEFGLDAPVRQAAREGALDAATAQSLVDGAVAALPFVNTNDLDGLIRNLEQRRQTIIERGGDTRHTDEILGMVRSGDPNQIQQAGQIITDVVAQGRKAKGTQEPSDVRSFRFFSALPKDEQEAMLNFKRAGKITTIGGVEHIVDAAGNATPVETPEGQATLQAELDAAEQLKEAESRGKVIGEAEAKIETAEPVAVALAEAKEIAGRPEASAEALNQIAQIDTTFTALQRAEENIGFFSTGRTGQLFALIKPGSSAGKVRRAVDTVKASLGLDELATLKRLSANGASGLGQQSERELDALQRRAANLDPLADPDELRESMNIIFDKYSRVKESLQLQVRLQNNEISLEDARRLNQAIYTRQRRSGRSGMMNNRPAFEMVDGTWFYEDTGEPIE